VIPRLSIPALSFRDSAGRLDEATTAAYAQRAAATWLSCFILNGTTTEGDTFTVPERRAVLDIWRRVTTTDRLLACCWEPADLSAAIPRGIRPLMVMRDLPDEAAALALFAWLPGEAYVYSHPMHTSTVLDATLLTAARESGCLPAGAKISKIPAGALPGLRAAAGAAFDLWDGSARAVERSLRDGASGVVVTPLTAVPDPFPAPDDALQDRIDRRQADFDALPDAGARAAWLRASAVSPSLPGGRLSL
jgi:dihydrodipicolinate synthase/N-acetylneuraminate lyase